jgi:hypothetical protein
VPELLQALFTAIADVLTKWFKTQGQVMPPTTPVVIPPPAIHPVRQWFIDRLGWTEQDHDKELAKGWIYTQLKNFKTVIGISNAWCAMAVNTALVTNGYVGTGDAGADSFIGYGPQVEPQEDAICVIRHVSGRFHVTLFSKWVDKEKKIGRFLGGNQNDSICYADYNVSGNKSGRDELISCCMPIKAKAKTT